MKILRKENKYSFDSIRGYDRMIVITQDNSSLDAEDEELEIKDVNKKSEVIKAFKNFSSSKKTSRVLATKFAESIAYPKIEKAWKGKRFRGKAASRYADKNQAEWFVENFTLYEMGKNELIDPSWLQFFKENVLWVNYLKKQKLY